MVAGRVSYAHAQTRVTTLLFDAVSVKRPVLFDCRVAALENCFPMIPSGAAHTDMILAADQVTGVMDDEAKALV